MNTEVIHLFRKYLNNRCSPQELDRVLEHVSLGEHQTEWDFVLTEEADKVIDNNFEADLTEKEIAAVDRRIQHTISKKPSIVSLRRRNISLLRISVAAMFFLILGVSLYFYRSKPQAVEVVKALPVNDIAPGGNKAVLTLADGKKIVLTDAQNGQIAEQNGIKVAKTAEGQIIFTSTGANLANPAGYNTIETPKGGQFQILLSDGTKVWLNAASSIRFPASFASRTERKVELNGEAYFEVAHNKAVPFRVSSPNQLVEVLGTHFNVNAYNDESAIKTTLLEGSVKVTHTNTSGSQLLRPGQQASLSGTKLSKQEVDTELAVAWKNNVFMFEQDDIGHIMRMVARWYDVSVVYMGDVPKDTFSGYVSKFDNVSEVLKTLELTGKVNFKVQGRRIIVTR